MPDVSSTVRLLGPKILTTLAEGYHLRDFRKDIIAAVTVAIVALPLSMAIAIASGVSPERGLYTAIVGGFVVSLLSGSRFQIGGPAGAFIVLVAATVSRFGVSGLLLAVLISGLMLTVLGALRLGSLIRHIPHAVTVGFTCAIAVTIAASQVKDLGGLRLPGAEPGPVIPKLMVLGGAVTTVRPSAMAIGVATVLVILLTRRLRPSWPAMLIGVLATSLAAAWARLPIDTIGSRFGGLPHGLPVPTLPPVSGYLAAKLLSTACSFTLLGAIESLLSAKVADGMTGRKHRPNTELIAQGLANVASAMFGGISVTGAIARTATNVRAGGVSPVSGMMHSAFLLIFILLAAPLAAFIPLAALAGVLVVVSWNMAERAEFTRLLKHWRTAAVLLATFLLTLVRDLTTGIVAGCVLAAAISIAGRAVPEEG